MSPDKIILWVIGIGVLVGGIDRILGNRFGLGEKFEEGFNAMGPLALGMVGIVTLAPVIAKVLGPIIIPIFDLIGADPAMFATILANDMGGYPLAMELARNEQAGLLAGLIVASMLGCTIVFSIPVGLGLIEYEDRPFFAKGLLVGLITIPFGGIIGGLVAGFDLSMVLINMVPVIVLSVILAAGLIYIPNTMINCALAFGKFIVVIITVGLSSAAFQEITGVILIPGMAPIMDGLIIIGQIGVVLLGTFPILTLLVKILEKPLSVTGEKLGMNATSAAGIVFTLANSIPVYKMMKDMDDRGKVINTAWLVPATAALGDHLGFTAGVRPDMITPVVIGKLSAGILAILFAMWACKDLSNEIKQSEDLKSKKLPK
ncbi:ethanolamine utilization protein EutH [Tepidanaerobacter syntrophicus]|uniref:ethanolamine utilization protein EutH n=1 Tax=Tepidanaerobacter syntrophicus TaxID=224999 RepID=UPI0022EDBF6D|nr:ethanolamine utilization protein EutH [Tepidanaerobacter syntrophicus]GLI51862.1 ethanolamine utilization protein EutH [Tepidanaerobacter syntrophicus]